MASAVEHYQQAEEWVTSLIMGPPTPPPGTPPEEVRARAVARLERLRAFLGFLGNPQRRYRVVHVAGTSGKGSTTVLTAAILRAAGFRTGAHVSPYLQVATEKLQVDGQIASAARYAEVAGTLREAVDAWVRAGNERPNYGEVWVALTLQYFAKERVDVAVVEVGAGGRFDVTNVVEPEVAVVTSVGWDHVSTLGPTLRDIAWHKAGIIKPGAVAISGVTEPEAVPVIAAEAAERGVTLRQVRAGADWRDVQSGPEGTSFLDVPSGRRMRLALPGAFQAQNAAVAAAAARAFDARVRHDAVAAGLAAARFPGRLEIVNREPPVVLDGAHNPEKMAALVASLRELFPGRRTVVVFGALESKSYGEMLAQLAPYAAYLVATAPSVLAKPAISAAEVAALAPPPLPAEAVGDPLVAVARALELAGPDDLVLVTGSLYLVGNVRERWYPTERILEQGTLWPA